MSKKQGFRNLKYELNHVLIPNRFIIKFVLPYIGSIVCALIVDASFASIVDFFQEFFIAYLIGINDGVIVAHYVMIRSKQINRSV